MLFRSVGKPFITTLGVMLAVGVLMTIGVYGLVAGIVKLDDLGLRWVNLKGSSGVSAVLRKMGSVILWFAPHLLRFLSVGGTLAMFLVGGEIITHQFEILHHWSESFVEWFRHLPALGTLLGWLSPVLFNLVLGVVAGAVAVAVAQIIPRMIGGGSKHKSSGAH